jgi:hypothetical protein
MTAGATERNFIETRQSVLDAQAMVHQTDRQLAQNPSSNLMLKPISRTSMIMQAIPGVGKPGAAKLQPFVQKFFQHYTADTGYAGLESPNTRFRREDAAMLGRCNPRNSRTRRWSLSQAGSQRLGRTCDCPAGIY